MYMLMKLANPGASVPGLVDMLEGASAAIPTPTPTDACPMIQWPTTEQVNQLAAQLGLNPDITNEFVSIFEEAVGECKQEGAVQNLAEQLRHEDGSLRINTNIFYDEEFDDDDGEDISSI